MLADIPLHTLFFAASHLVPFLIFAKNRLLNRVFSIGVSSKYSSSSSSLAKENDVGECRVRSRERVRERRVVSLSVEVAI